MKKGTVTAIVLLLTFLLVTSASADTDPFLDFVFHPFTLDSGNGTCVSYDDSAVGLTRNCDPLNLVFVDQSVQELGAALQQLGWSTSGLGSNQSLHFVDGQLRVQDLQLYWNESYTRRYHIRLWQVPGKTTTLGAVHHEKGLFTHTIDRSWENSEAFVAGQLCGPGYVCGVSPELAVQSTIQFAQSDDLDKWRDWENNGRLTVIAPTYTNHLPIIVVNSPEDGESFHEGTLIAFSGAANDEEDGNITSGLSWHSNLDGFLDSGGSVSAVLSRGTHTVTASVTDSAGDSSSLSITVHVVPIPGQSLSVNVWTDKTDYRNREKVLITVLVKEGSEPVAGVPAQLEIITASDNSRLDGAISDVNGLATFQYRVNARKDGIGTYTVNVEASAPGYDPVIGSITFSVTG